MKRYIARRLMQGVVLLFMVATIVFFLGRLTGNPVDLMLPEDATAEDRAALTQTLGLDGPILDQYAIFVGKAMHGDLGMSIRMKQPAAEAFFDRLPNTLVLIPWAILLGMMLGIPWAWWRRSTVAACSTARRARSRCWVSPCRASGWASC